MFIFAIILVVFALIAIGTTWITDKQYRVWNKVIAGALLFIALCFAIGSTVNSVPAQRTAVPVTFGHTQAEVSSGIHFLNPFTHLVSYPTTVQDYRMAAEKTEGVKNAIDDSVPFTGADNGQLSADVDVYYLVSNATKAYHTVGNLSRIDDVFVRGQVRAAINKEANKVSSDILLHSITTIVPNIVNDLQPAFEADGLTLQQIQIRNPVPGANLAAKLTAQQNIQKAQADQQAATIQAQTAVIQAKGQADAARALGQVIEQFPNVTCNTFVQGLIDGKITGPVYVAPGCTSTPGVVPLVSSSAAAAGN